jgi:PAS domain-containing protein
MIAPHVLFVLVLLMDALVPQTTVSGLVGLLVLACLAFILKPMEVVIWTLIFTAAFVIRLIWEAGPDIHWGTVTVRASTVFLGGIVCVILCMLRVRVHASRDDLLHVIMSLPVPALVANGDGIIKLCNDRMASMFADSGHDLIGSSFFSFFSDPKRQGRAIARYVEWIDLGVVPKEEVAFDLRNSPISNVMGSVSTCTLQGRRYVIVCLRPPVSD